MDLGLLWLEWATNKVHLFNQSRRIDNIFQYVHDYWSLRIVVDVYSQ